MKWQEKKWEEEKKWLDAESDKTKNNLLEISNALIKTGFPLEKSYVVRYMYKDEKTLDFIKKAVKVHGPVYDYTYVDLSKSAWVTSGEFVD